MSGRDGGVIEGPDGEDTVPVLLMLGEHVYDANGKLLFVVGAPDEE